MRILTFSDYYHPHVGGVEQVVQEVGRRLVRRGHEIRIVALDTDRVGRQEQMEDGIFVHHARTAKLTSLTGMQSSFSPEALMLAWQVARTFRPDILHAHNLFFTTALAAVALKPLIRRPLVTTMHLGSMGQLGRGASALVTAYERIAGRLILRSATGRSRSAGLLPGTVRRSGSGSERCG